MTGKVEPRRPNIGVRLPYSTKHVVPVDESSVESTRAGEGRGEHDRNGEEEAFRTRSFRTRSLCAVVVVVVCVCVCVGREVACCAYR